MLLNLVGQVTLFDALFELDVQFARECRQRGCLFCGGRLDSAAYSRKPRGGPEELPERYCQRLSLCCAREGCRRRALPPSCLFMGLRVYLAAAIVASCALRQSRPPGKSLRELAETLGVSRQTLLRWLDWFKNIFPATPAWQRLRGLLDASVHNEQLPSGLLGRFLQAAKDPVSAFIDCLRFLASGHNPVIQHTKWGSILTRRTWRATALPP